jgi:hypothetical protein
MCYAEENQRADFLGLGLGLPATKIRDTSTNTLQLKSEVSVCPADKINFTVYVVYKSLHKTFSDGAATPECCS